MKTRMLQAVCGGALAVSASACWAQVYNVTIDRPAQDRWMYPFNFSAGQETRASLFGATLVPDFDDRDSTFIVSWNTASLVPPGSGASKYHIIGAKAKITVQSLSTTSVFYDPSFDPLQTYLDPGNPDYVPDADASRPFEVYGTGFRNGYTAATFTEDLAFGCPGPSFQGCRSAFPVDGAGADISSNVKNGVEVTPWGIGQNATLTPGEVIPADTEFTFDLDLCSSGVRAYLQNGLNDGSVILTFCSLAPAAGGGGGGGGDFARFYTDENPQGPAFGRAPKIEINVRVYSGADFNGDEQVDFFDYLDFAQAFSNESPDADFNSDCQIDFFDYLDFAAEFSR